MTTRKERAKRTLEWREEARDDDMEGYAYDAHIRCALDVHEYVIFRDLLKKAGSPETYRRARQLVQAEHPELGPTKRIAKLRNEKEERAVVTKGKSITDDRRYPPLDDKFYV